MEVDAPWLRDAEVARPAAEIGFGEQRYGIYGESTVHLNVVTGEIQLAGKILGHAAGPYEKPLFRAA